MTLASLDVATNCWKLIRFKLLSSWLLLHTFIFWSIYFSNLHFICWHGSVLAGGFVGGFDWFYTHLFLHFCFWLLIVGNLFISFIFFIYDFCLLISAYFSFYSYYLLLFIPIKLVPPIFSSFIPFISIPFISLISLTVTFSTFPFAPLFVAVALFLFISIFLVIFLFAFIFPSASIFISTIQ